ncbi:flagellar filament capping protein FliD [Anaerobacillus sp. CMMVII]|uniref:flagellar filament capping protein FliD n=1 Tax=Anaerobacillus sp. CMMVII TaxID=2755588 RepID=UPI0021B77F6D|nr:flagellar filament capping protein FliD [Anaerobacillus sp. CMMVII]MCT8140157.1 flagellar filament capping protein FliD [Anaerobacillus sp. CMMVII]
MRIGGLASGMDTDQMIKDLMRVQRLPMDKLTQRKQTIEWQRDAYRSINTQMAKYNTNIFDTIMRSANMSAKTVTSSNSSRITATATAAAANSSFTIKEVKQLATAATNVSQGAISADPTVKIDPTQTLQSQYPEENVGDFGWKKGKIQNESLTLTEKQSMINLQNTDFVENQADLLASTIVKVNGKQFEVVTTKDGLKDNQVYFNMVDKKMEFSKDLEIGAKVSVTYATKSETEKYFTSSITTFNTSGVPQVEKFTFQGDKTLNQVIQEINSSPAGVSMFYDSFTDRVTVQRKETGNHNPGGQEMIFEGSFFTNVLKLNTSEEKGGDNAKFTINGLETERPTNNFTINGVTITLKEAFTDSPVTLNVNTNTDKIFDTIKGFVDEYNELLATINGKLKEERYRDFRPLTDEQKEAMSEKDIEKWEEKAMSGMLRNDQTLSNALDRMRSAMYSPVSLSGDNPTFKQLAELGITTSRDFMERGKLEIDEAKLRAAIEKDPDGVFRIFNADGPTSAEKGLARRMRENLAGAMDQVAERAGGSRGKNLNHQFTLGRNITDIDRQISNFERRLKQIEDRYWKQFSAMEKAMQQANSQAETMFAQLFGGQ